jgi:hypothetical protein
MPRFRVEGSLLVATALVAGVSVHAQFGNPLNRLPKTPSVPGVARPAPPATERRPYGSGITDEMITQYIKAITVQKQVLANELAAAKAKKAQADALAQKRAEAMVGDLTKTSECSDAFREKDPRSKTIFKLEGLAEAATNSGNDAKAEEYQKQSSQLEQELAIAADRACGGRRISALHDCMEKKKAELAKSGVSEPMLTVQAQGGCMQDPATSGTPGMTAPCGRDARRWTTHPRHHTVQRTRRVEPSSAARTQPGRDG